MKKILFLLLVCFIKLNAYEYFFYQNNLANESQAYQDFFVDPDGILKVKIIYKNGNESESSLDRLFYDHLNYFGKNSRYITRDIFYGYYSNDLLFLNDLYTQKLNPFLNYLYNENSFSHLNYINYEDYQILYNENGLAVESIVNGNWSGLYDGPDNSGYLYNEKGDLLYKNGVPVSFLEKINDKLLKKFKINLESIFIKKIFYPLLVLIFACVIFRSVIRMAFKAFLIRFYDKKIGQFEKRREKIENA